MWNNFLGRPVHALKAFDDSIKYKWVFVNMFIYRNHLENKLNITSLNSRHY